MTRRAFRKVQAERIARRCHRWPVRPATEANAPGELRRQHAWNVNRAGLYRRAGMKRDARTIVSMAPEWRRAWPWKELPA